VVSAFAVIPHHRDDGRGIGACPIADQRTCPFPVFGRHQTIDEGEVEYVRVAVEIAHRHNQRRQFAQRVHEDARTIPRSVVAGGKLGGGMSRTKGHGLHGQE
jgi:hypothetical protein